MKNLETRLFGTALGMVVVGWVVSFSVTGGLIYIAVHFIRKLW